MNKLQRQKAYDQKVLLAMMRIYCQRNHNITDGLCPACAALLEYARQRIEKCPLAEVKISCRKCEIHCYASLQKEQIGRVMRFSGPRMLFSHPIMTIRHLTKERF